MPGFLTLQEAAQILRCHPRTVTRKVQRGELRAYRLGPVHRFMPSDLLACMTPDNAPTTGLDDFIRSQTGGGRPS